MAPSALGAFQRSRLGGFTRSTLGARDAQVRQGSSIVTIISSSMAGGDGPFSYVSDSWMLIGRSSNWYGGSSTIPTVPAIPETDATLHYESIREQAARLDRAVIIFLQIVPNAISQFDLIRAISLTTAVHAEFDFPPRPLPLDAAGLRFGPDVEFHHVIVPATTYMAPGPSPGVGSTGPHIGRYTNYSVDWSEVFADLSASLDTGSIGLVFAGFHGGLRTTWEDFGPPGTAIGVGRDPGSLAGVASVFGGNFTFEQAFHDAAAGAGIPPSDIWRGSGGIVEPIVDPPLLQKVAFAFEYAAEHP